MGKETELVTPLARAAATVDEPPLATAVPEATVEVDAMFMHDLNKPMLRRVTEEFSGIPEAKDLVWEDDFFDEDDIVAAFDFDYEMMESYYTSVGWVWLGATILYTPLFIGALFAQTPCYLRKNVRWSVEAQHVAITRDGIRFVREKRRQCWGWPMCDAGRSSKTVPFDKITDCDIEEPAGNTCLVVPRVLTTVNIDTASSGEQRHELQISGLKNPHAFKKLVWGMKRARGLASGESATIPRATNNNELSELLRDIRDELRQNNALLSEMKDSSTTTPNTAREPFELS